MLANKKSFRKLFFTITNRLYSTNSRNALIKRLPKPKVPEILTSTRSDYLRHLYEHNPEWEKEDPYAHSLAHPDYFGVTNHFTVRDMMEARVHLGHKYGRQAAAMNQFIFGERLGVSVFDLNKTKQYFNLALNFLAHVAYRGGIILFVTNDRNTKFLVEKTAKQCQEYAHCHPWLKGTLVNSENYFRHTIRHPDAIVLTNCMYRFQMHKVIKEAAKMSIPTLAIIDSDFEYPQSITYPIPGNDDTMESIQFYLKHIKYAIIAGKTKRRENFGSDTDSRQESDKVFKEVLRKKQIKESGDNVDDVGSSTVKTEAAMEVGSSSRGTRIMDETGKYMLGDDDEITYFDDESEFDPRPKGGSDK